MNETGVNEIEKIFETCFCTLKRKRRRPRSDSDEMSSETEEKMADYLSHFRPIRRSFQKYFLQEEKERSRYIDGIIVRYSGF